VEAGAISSSGAAPGEGVDQATPIPVSFLAVGAVGRGAVWIPWPRQAASGRKERYLGSFSCLVSRPAATWTRLMGRLGGLGGCVY
jgi:hypothetical protein